MAISPAGQLPVHRLHDDEIERLLATGERRQELVALLGEPGYRELSALARRAATRRGPTDARVYVLPGLMGSRLGSRGVLLDDVLWVDLIEIAAGHLTRLALPRGAKLVALGAMLLNALKLKLSLRIAGFEARLHPYDWRRSVGVLAAELNSRIAREAPRGGVLLVGHSLGGVVARVALGRESTPRIARVVQLGAPNHGSFAPVLALRGVYPTVRKLAALDRRHDAEDLARIVFRTLPALHELLPDPRLAGGPNLFDASEWPDDELRPDAGMLAAAAAERAGWPEADPRCLHIAGVRQDTVVGVAHRGAEFEYAMAPQGDATVPMELAVRPGEPAWFVGEHHGALPNNSRVIAAAVDLLRRGTTRRLPRTTARARVRTTHSLTESTLRRVAPHKLRWEHLSPDSRRRLLEPVVSPEFHGSVAPAALARAHAARIAASPSTATTPRRVLEVRLVRGSIVDANARALVLGVFRNVDPSGPAAAIDAALGGAIREFTLRRMFAAQLGQVFVMPALRSSLLAEFVLFAGLGDFGALDGAALSFVAENVVRTFARTQVEDFATVLFGAGSGVPVATATTRQLEGFLTGLAHADPGGVVRRITVCELDRRKYGVLVRATRKLAASAAAAAEITVLVDEAAGTQPVAAAKPARQAGRQSGLPAPDLARPRDPAYLLVGLEPTGRSEFSCRSSLLTAGAKAAVLSGATTFARAGLQRTIAALEDGTATSRDLPRVGTALARLLLPPSVRDGLEAMAARALVVVHDREASRVPWEVLRIGDAHPALSAGLTRRYASETLSVARWREEPAAPDTMRLLLAVDPTQDLPGAAAEGEALQELLRRHGIACDVLRGRDATRPRMLAALASGAYDVLHFAGHAYFDAADPGAGGLLCAGREVLRGSDLEVLTSLPALVFCNACEAARVRQPRRTPATSRAFGLRRSMTGLAEAFLAGGVANFMGTHWPVGDEAAFAYSSALYASLLQGERLGDAVLAGRKRVAAIPSVDWADYVHYGNAEFQLLTAPL